MSEQVNAPNDEPSQDELFRPSSLRRFGEVGVRVAYIERLDGEPNQLDLMRKLEPEVEKQLARHNDIREFWVPRDFFPIDADGRIINRAQDLPGEQPLLSPTAQAAMIVNLLTEDNLPSYHRLIADSFDPDGVWRTWTDKWTAEENRHAYVMRNFLDLTGAVDTTQLEVERMSHMENGYDKDKDPLHALAYVSFQEMATRISHRNTGEATNDTIANAMLARIAKDENLHMLFYRNIVKAAFDFAPNQTMRAVADEVIGFEMPGAGIDHYMSRSLMIASAGIYDLRKHIDEVVNPILRFWKVYDRADLTGDGEVARDALATYIVDLEKRAGRFEHQRADGLIDKLIKRALASESAS